MGHTLADYDLDGTLDFYVIGMSSTTARRLDQLKLGRQGHEDIQQMRKEMGYGNRMYLRRGPRYEAPRFAASVARTGWSWGTTSQDFDNDGDKDIYVANGNWSGDSAQDYCTRYWCHDVYTGTSQANDQVKTLLYDSLKDLNTGRISWNGFEKNALLLNVSRPNGIGRDFVNVAFLFGVSFAYDSRAVVADDLDGDGRVDLLVAQFTWTQYTPNSKGFEMDLNVYRNQIETDNHWIGVQLREEGPGRSPIGAKISVRVGDRKHVGRIVTGDSFLAQHANTVHFGIGQAEKVDSIEVRWPDGARTVLRNPAIDQYHRLRPEK